ncbi:cell division protein FtsA [Oikeobacillus pervagus]|uniref:Cell division protein FtsA n=1 Tax=Oikeobacillus pervagus TaxID=1325931 RepID=A0AAJ1SYA0_9BACI|nr:cell division protein FtsA [Oikeobacillus pervagus]MDQ0215035.1 cell division protein FtsA [Oikeobacillus pervagus]
MQPQEKIFALDIGTRSVVGIILEVDGESYHVIDIAMKEHDKRAMLDGQIHDILSVSKLITEIKEILEEKHGPLHRVCVAAAGRALRTETATKTISIKGKPIITKDDILHLELSAVQKAQSQAASKDQSDRHYHYYCVGYSVLYYRLDGEKIGSLIDQQGEEASVEIIATFLPRVVVESLIAALNRSQLEMEALTLEPIAAINILIPPSMRRLNVALVDIGAGTSDIAMTNHNTIIAYGMVPIAGDEITESLSDEYLLDFPVAENVKRNLITDEEITITDILGFDSTIPRKEVIQKISPAIDKLTDAIATEILKLNNGQPPKAVMLVGGGSLTPELPKRLSEKLQLPSNRVAIRGSDAIQSLTIHPEITHAPTLVTPVGIAIAARKAPVHYKTIYLNEEPVRLFELKDLTVGDGLLASGIKVNKLYGKPGAAIMTTVNGQLITIPGQYGQPPTLLKNGNACQIDDPIKDGDQIIVKKGEDGKDAAVKIKDLINDPERIDVFLNEKKVEIPLMIMKNGEIVEHNDWVIDGDIIETSFLTVQELFIQEKKEHWLKELKPFFIHLNQKKTFFPTFSAKLMINNKRGEITHPLQHGDQIEFYEMIHLTVQNIAELKKYKLKQSIPITFNGKNITITKNITEFYRNKQKLTEQDLVHMEDKITVRTEKFDSFIFQDVFRHVEVNMPENAKGTFILLKNNVEATFYDPIQAGDHLEILWPLATKKTIKKTANGKSTLPLLLLFLAISLHFTFAFNYCW